MNPLSLSKWEQDGDGKFTRAFRSHPFVARHQHHGQVVVGIDGAFMKHQVYKEQMVILVGRDGQNYNITLAVALCESEHSPPTVSGFSTIARKRAFDSTVSRCL